DVLVVRHTWRGQSDGTTGQRRVAHEGELPVRQPRVGRRTVIGARPYYAPPTSDDVRSSGAAHKWPRSPGCIVLAVETLVGFRKEPVLFRREGRGVDLRAFDASSVERRSSRAKPLSRSAYWEGSKPARARKLSRILPGKSVNFDAGQHPTALEHKCTGEIVLPAEHVVPEHPQASGRGALSSDSEVDARAAAWTPRENGCIVHLPNEGLRLWPPPP